MEKSLVFCQANYLNVRMRNITGFDKVTKMLGEFRFSEFRIIKELHFYETHDEFGQTQKIDLTIESEDRTPNYQLKLTFCGIAGLRLDDFGGGQTRIIGLDIVDATEKQWEGVLWEVLDFENNAMEFRAKTAEIVSVAPVIS